MPSTPDSQAAPSKESWIFHQSHSLGTRPNSKATAPSPTETPDYLLKVLSNRTPEAKALGCGSGEELGPTARGSGEGEGGGAASGS